MLNKFRNLLRPPPSTSKYPTPVGVFHSNNYLSYISQRFEHLASLSIPFAGRRSLDASSLIPVYATYYLGWGRPISMTEVRQENVDVLRAAYGR